MTKEQKAKMTTQVYEKITERFEIAHCVCATLVSVANEHPDVIENLGILVAKYWTVFRPLFREATTDAVEIRKTCFLQFKAMGLSDELAVKMTTGV